MTSIIKTIAASALTAFACFGAVSAQAASYQVTQGGFEGGGTLSLSFDASDLNADGYVSSWDDEVGAYAIDFSGSSLLKPAASSGPLAYPATVLFKYKLGSAYFGDESEEAVYIAPRDSGLLFMISPADGPRPLIAAVEGETLIDAGLPNQRMFVTSRELASITAVPETGSAGLMWMGLTSIACLALARRSKPLE